MLRLDAVRSVATTLFLGISLSLQAFAAGPNIYIQHNLVSDVPGLADVTDASLVNPWGVSLSATSPFWVTNNGKGNTTLYNGSGVPSATIVTIPSGAGGPTPSSATGQVNNSNTTNFLLANGRSASFIFSTEDGTISAWNTGTVATVMVDNSAASAVYKGLAIGGTAAAPLLYAPNFRSGAIDVFDGKFARTTVTGGFVDPNLPAGFAPFNIWNLGGNLYVLYAKQDAAKKLDVPGPGNGFVNVFDQNGTLIKRLVSNGVLNSPWGVAIAPANWGAFGGAVLVGNFGNGTINAFDATTGTLLGTVQDQAGKNIVLQGLWALVFGNGRASDKNTLYFAAGITNGDTKVHGLFGSLAPPAAVTGLLNGASNLSPSVAAVSPGEVVVVTGGTIGPSPLVSNVIPTTGTVGTTLTTTTATFNGTLAPILWASTSATAVVVPYEIAGSATANVVIKYRGETTAAFPVNVAATVPGVFTFDGSGSGPVVALNQDGTVNSATNAAPKGTVVFLFATGEGTTNPPGQTGAVTGLILREPVLQVAATIGGQTAPLLYTGTAPGFISGVMLVEAIIPSTVTATGAVPVAITVNAVGSQAGTTIFVK